MHEKYRALTVDEVRALTDARVYPRTDEPARIEMNPDHGRIGPEALLETVQMTVYEFQIEEFVQEKELMGWPEPVIGWTDLSWEHRDDGIKLSGYFSRIAEGPARREFVLPETEWRRFLRARRGKFRVCAKPVVLGGWQNARGLDRAVLSASGYGASDGPYFPVTEGMAEALCRYVAREEGDALYYARWE